jgi:hypothetical protein
VQLVRKFTAFYETRGSISCSQACAAGPHPEPTESTPTHFIKVSFNIIVSSTPKSPNALCPSHVTIKILYALLVSPYARKYSARYFLWLIFLQTFGTEYALWNFPLCSLLRLPVSNPILGPTTSARFTYSRCSDQATGWTIRGSITGTRRNFLFFESPDQFRGPPSLLSNGYRGVFSESNATGMCNWPLNSIYYQG